MSNDHAAVSLDGDAPRVAVSLTEAENNMVLTRRRRLAAAPGRGDRLDQVLDGLDIGVSSALSFVAKVRILEAVGEWNRNQIMRLRQADAQDKLLLHRTGLPGRRLRCRIALANAAQLMLATGLFPLRTALFGGGSVGSGSPGALPLMRLLGVILTPVHLFSYPAAVVYSLHIMLPPARQAISFLTHLLRRLPQRSTTTKPAALAPTPCKLPDRVTPSRPAAAAVAKQPSQNARPALPDTIANSIPESDTAEVDRNATGGQASTAAAPAAATNRVAATHSELDSTAARAKEGIERIQRDQEARRAAASSGSSSSNSNGNGSRGGGGVDPAPLESVATVTQNLEKATKVLDVSSELRENDEQDTGLAALGTQSSPRKGMHSRRINGPSTPSQ